ncbi:MAG TPA: glycosyltransferase family 1 protein [Pseudoxanthomonas sp.]|nr:glycosyltransferase family 1 protein [Pseudoxanthomonas sp.]
MRYAIVTETYPPEVNGVALTVQGLELGLRARGHDVTLVRPRQDNDSLSGQSKSTPPQSSPALRAREEAESKSVISNDHTLLVRGAGLPRYPGLKFGLPAGNRLAREWAASPPDAIYVATEGPLGWSALRTARKLGIPAATGFHTRFDQYMRDYGFPFLESTALRWMRRFHNGGQATLVPTRELADFLQSQDFRHVRRLARAVDAQQFHPGKRDLALRRQWGLEDSGLAVIYLGRIAPEKNLDLAVRAYRELQRQRPDARFVWVGDGPARAKLAEENPDFVFCGLQRGDDVARHFASADLFLFPSHSETFGNTTLEAMASGVPTVAFDYGAAREHVDNGIDGIAVDNDADFIAAAARLGVDDAARRAMGARAHEAMQRLHPEQVAADFDALLADLANNTPANTRRSHASAAAA